MTPRFAYHPFIAAALLLAAMNAAPGNPLNGQVVGGAATVQGQGTATVTIQQSTDRAIINWQTFNIGAGETTQFVQPSTSSITLNRVIGGMGASTLDGTLTANGRVFIVNPDGLLFGKNSVINTGGFLATTNDIKNDDFMAGRHNFNLPGRPDASIVNQGSITAASGGFAALVAPGVRNTGSIIATLGQVTMASGNVFTLDLYGDKLITLAPGDAIAAQVKDVATGLPLTDLVKNEGQIKANGGRVELTAAAARQVVDAVINNSGVIEANSIGTKNGMIVLGAASEATKPAGAPEQTVRVSGKLLASGKNAGEKGGTVAITGESISVAGATIDVSGQAGGGTALIGGDVGGGRGDAAIAALNPKAALQPYAVANASTVSVDAASTIDASAKQSGDGGKVVVWSNGATNFAGLILARGGDLSGNGGFAEVSGSVLNVSGLADMRAPNGAAGTVLFDPTDFYIMTGAAPDGASSRTPALLAQQLGLANVTIETSGTNTGEQTSSIFVNENVSWTGDNSLTLRAHRDININAIIANDGGGSLNLRADKDGTGTGTVHFNAETGGVYFEASTGFVNLFYNPATPIPNHTHNLPNTPTTKYQTTPTFAQYVMRNESSDVYPNQLNAYMLVNSATDLQLIQSNLSGKYALGRNIDATETATWGMSSELPAPGFMPIGFMSNSFVGVLDGLGHKISNLFIAPDHAQIQTIGLFGVVGQGGVVANLTLENATVVANPNSSSDFAQFVGVLAGSNGGLISNVSATGTLNGNPGSEGLPNGIITGGLVGQNGIIQSIFGDNQVYIGEALFAGTIRNAHVNVNVTVGDASGSSSMNNVGGLAGSNVAGSTIDGSSASGSVTAGANSLAGGLVGANGYSGFEVHQIGTIKNSTAAGNVTITGLNSGAGGLVGSIGEGSLVEKSTAFGNVTSNAGNSDSWTSVGGLAGQNDGWIVDSKASGLVSSLGATEGFNFAQAGGLVGSNMGWITGSSAGGNVTLGAAVLGFAGGLVGINQNDGDSQNSGRIEQSFATGAVTGGDASVVDTSFIGIGGLVGVNLGGSLIQTAAGGVVTGGAGSWVGGLVGWNIFGSIEQSYAIGATIGGSGSLVGGLVALNFGSIDQTYATGLVTGGAESTLGGLIAVDAFAAPTNNLLATDADPLIASTVTSSFFTTDGTGQTSSAAGTPITTTQLASALPLGFDPIVWTNNSNTTLPQLPGFPGVVFTPGSTDPFIDPNLLFANFNGFAPPPVPSTDPVVTLVDNTPPPPPPGGNAANNAPPPGQGLGRTPNEQRFSGVPPLNENRFIPNEVVVQILSEIPRVRVIEIARTLGLTIIASETLGGRTVYRFQTGDGQSIRDVILAWERNQIVASAQPNYTFGLAQQQQQQPDLSDADTTSALPGSDPELPPSRALGQYVIGKFKLDAVHKRARGDNVLVAVIDSAIDRNHPELRDVVTDSFVAGGGESKPHSHGTAMAGAIAARRQLMGVAPGVRILAIDAFSPSASGAQGTSFQILRGIDWAVARGARVINMSFAGPRDLMIERSLKTARDNGVILIAAAGNAGPKSPPLFPAADPNVIAVTATDSDDKVFAGANRGTHLAVAAPGVDILALGPEGSYQLTTGTSVAAAHVTGIAALLLHRNPSISPDDVRKVLTTSARNLGKAKNDQTGSGLVDPERALDALERTPLSDKSASAAQPRQR